MSTDENDSFAHENWFEAFRATGEQFDAENDDLEAILEGDIGFHAFFAADADDPTRGVQTAIYQGIYDKLNELHVDADIVRLQHGEVTPETVWLTLRDQLEEFTYLSEPMLLSIEERVKERVEKNLDGGGGS